MVQEILQSNEQEELQRDYDNNGGGSDNGMYATTCVLKTIISA